MINYDSILSAFDGKPTLLQWLKMVKKALDESVLKDITVSQDGASAVFTFNFEDGTSISTPAVTLPKGDTGAKGDKGEQGVSVTGVDEVSNEVVGGQTLTTLRFNFSNGTNNEVVVHAENGKNASGGGSKTYLHSVKISDATGINIIYFNMYSSKEAVTLDDALAQIPISNSSTLNNTNTMPVVHSHIADIGVLVAAKYRDGNNLKIAVTGVVFDREGNTVNTYTNNFLPGKIVDTLLAEI